MNLFAQLFVIEALLLGTDMKGSQDFVVGWYENAISALFKSRLKVFTDSAEGN